MNEWIDNLGNQDFYFAERYKYEIGQVKEKHHGVDWNLELKVWTGYFISISMSIYLSIHLSIYHLSSISKCFPLLGLPFEQAIRNYTALVLHTPSAQILLSKYHSPLEGTRIPWRNSWFQDCGRDGKSWTWNILWWQNIRRSSKKWWGNVKSPLETSLEVLLLSISGTVWAYKQVKTVMNYNPLNKIEIHES